jgi:hypothetical protein
MIADRHDALAAIDRAWATICSECMGVLGSELHYQAMIYHALREAGVPVDQLAMNVKQEIENVRSELFKRYDLRKNEAYRGGFEPIPDVVIFSRAVNGDWRRRQARETVKCMLSVIEVKASERPKARLTAGEVALDIRKLAAHRTEIQHLGSDFHPVMLVIDSARDAAERMTEQALVTSRELARTLGVEWRYVSPTEQQVNRPISVSMASES